MKEKQTDCAGCGQNRLCHLTGLGFAKEHWLCADCIRQQLGKIASDEDAKYQRERGNENHA